MFSKLVRFLILIFTSTLLTFFLVNNSPIDPIKEYTLGNPSITETQKKQISDRWGLNESSSVRYWKWLKLLLTGNLGESVIYRQPVVKVISERTKNTLFLMLVSWLLTGILGYLSGVLMGIFEGSLFDNILKNGCFVLESLPTYWIGLLILMLFSVYLKWFPIGFSSPIGIIENQVTLLQRVYHLILPALTLSLTSISSLALYVRENTTRVFNSDYVLFSRARGLSKFQIFKKHGLKNTIGTASILQFSSFSELFGGSILAENVFSYPGLGTAIKNAALKSDVPLLLGITVFSVLFVFVGNLIADTLTNFIDPRIKMGV